MITVTTVRYQGDALTDTFSANMEQCNQYKQSIQNYCKYTKRRQVSTLLLFTNDLKAATECNIAFVIIR